MAPPVVAILVAHASSTRLGETLESLAKQSYRELEVIVVTVDYAAVPDVGGRKVTVLPGPPRAGFAEAVTYGLANAGGLRAAYVLLCHDDVVLARDAVARMVARASDEGVAAVGAKLVEWDDPGVLQEVGAGLDRFAVRRSALDFGEVDAGQRDDTSDVLFSSDACLLVRADAFAEIGGFDERAWPLYEDIDLCWRLRAAGRRVVVATDARVRHAADLSRGNRTLDVVGLTEAVERGRLRFILKHFSRFGVALVLPQLAIAALVRVLVAAVRREFWKIRATVRAWSSVLREAFKLRRSHRRSRGVVDDRALLSIGAREAIIERRHERSEWLSSGVEALGALARRSRVLVREPVAWGCLLSAVVVFLILRSILFGATFTLGELRAPPTFGAAMSNLFSRVRSEGLDPFAPGTPGLVALGALRMLALSAARGEKLALLLPLVAAGIGGARIGRILELGPRGRGWLGVGAAANPVTFLFLRDGSIGGLATWAGAVWLAGSFVGPHPVVPTATERVRFYARWAIGFALVVALHPPALVALVALGVAIAAARRGDGYTETRVRALAAGVGGALVLLMPWSFEWFSGRVPLFGRSGWLVSTGWSGIAAATLGAGYALVGWLVVAYGGAILVGLTRTMLALGAVGGGAMIAGIAGAMPSETMLALVAACALVMIALVARAIGDELPRYELGLRHALVIAGAATLVVMWCGSAVFFVATGVRNRSAPVIASGVRESGRVLWLSSTTGGLRSWTTNGFGSRLGAFPPPGGPAERLAAGAVAAARTMRTHRAGSVLALADVSHVVTLDRGARDGIDSQSDLARAEVHEDVVLYRNDSWAGPALHLGAAPARPLSPRGLAATAGDATGVRVGGWPSRPAYIDPAPSDEGVVYLAGGPRRGWRVGNANVRIAAAGVYVPASALDSRAPVRAPRGSRALVPLEVIAALCVLAAWAAAAYLSRPVPADRLELRRERPIATGGPIAAVPALVLVGAFVLGWSGAPARAGEGLLSSAWYCPPIGSGFAQAVAIANPTDRRTEVLVRPALGASPMFRGFLDARSRTTYNIPPDRGAVVESYGERVAVATRVARRGNRDSTLCATDPRTLNLFPEGGRAATLAVPRLFERYVIYNPYSVVARASVRFLSANEMIAPPPLQDVQIKPGGFVLVNPEEQFEPMLDLSTVIRVWQGRAIVARRLTTVEQVSWSLSAPALTDSFLPRALTLNGRTKVIVLNATEDAARVRVDGFAEESTVPLRTFDVDANSRTSFDLNTFSPQARTLVVRMRADRPVAVESLVVPTGREQLSLLPALAPARRWVVPMAEQRQLVITNPGEDEVEVEVQRLGPGEVQATLTIPARGALVAPLAGVGEFGVVVRARRPVTVVAVGDAGAVAGSAF